MGKDEQHSLTTSSFDFCVLLLLSTVTAENYGLCWLIFKMTGFITFMDYNLWIKLITHKDLNLKYLIIRLEQH